MCLAGGERGRERRRRGGEREEREREGGPQFPNLHPWSLGGALGGTGCGTQGRPGRGGSGGSGLGPRETAGHPPQPARPGRTRQKPRSMHAGQTEGGLWAAQTHPHLNTQQASVRAGPEAQAGPIAGPPRPPSHRGSHREACVCVCVCAA